MWQRIRRWFHGRAPVGRPEAAPVRGPLSLDEVAHAALGPSPDLVRLHPPGALARFSVLGAWHYYFQYMYQNIVLFQRGDHVWLYPSPQPNWHSVPSKDPVTIDRLIAYAWPADCALSNDADRPG